jgi:hypothetical protein
MRPQQRVESDCYFCLYVGRKGDELSSRTYVEDHGFIYLHFTRAEIRRRYAKWIQTYFFPLVPRRYLQRMIALGAWWNRKG